MVKHNHHCLKSLGILNACRPFKFIVYILFELVDCIWHALHEDVCVFQCFSTIHLMEKLRGADHRGGHIHHGLVQGCAVTF